MRILFDGPFEFSGLHGFPSICQLWLAETDLHIFVVAKESPDNKGTSTTNAVEILLKDLRSTLLLPDKPVKWFEWLDHYSEPGLAFTEYDHANRSWRPSHAGDRAIINAIVHA
jgi:hypothetical protein